MQTIRIQIASTGFTSHDEPTLTTTKIDNTIDVEQCSYHDDIAADVKKEAPEEINSATAYLLKKASAFLWRTFKYVAKDGIVLLTKINDYALAEITDLSTSILISPPLLAAMKALRMITVAGEPTKSKGEYSPTTTHDTLPQQQQQQQQQQQFYVNYDGNGNNMYQDGLMFSQVPVVNTDNTENDIVITQVDVAVMARVALRNSHATEKIPGSTYCHHNTNIIDGGSLILSSHDEELTTLEGGMEDGGVDDFMQRNVPIIEVYFEDTVCGGVHDNITGCATITRHSSNSTSEPSFSWMMVPTNIKTDVMTRMSGDSKLTSDGGGDDIVIPESISISKLRNKGSGDCVNLESNVSSHTKKQESTSSWGFRRLGNILTGRRG
jgi:hypothetical protein